MRLTNEQIREMARNAVLGGNKDTSYTTTQAALVSLLIDFGTKISEAQEIEGLRKSG